jgi:hypothetical protein
MTDASDLALTPGDPTQTIHFKVAVGFNQVLAYVWSSVRAFPTRDELAKQAASNDPADRREYLAEAALSWGLVGCVAGLGMVVFGLPAAALLGYVPGGVVLSACAAVSFFCLTGTFNVLWRWYWYVPRVVKGGKAVLATGRATRLAGRARTAADDAVRSGAVKAGEYNPNAVKAFHLQNVFTQTEREAHQHEQWGRRFDLTSVGIVASARYGPTCPHRNRGATVDDTPSLMHPPTSISPTR